MHVYGRLSSAREKFIFGGRSAELAISLDGFYATRHVLSASRIGYEFYDPISCFLIGECNLALIGARRPVEFRLHSPRGSNWDR